MRDVGEDSVQDGLFDTDSRFARMREELEASGRFRVLEALTRPATFSPSVEPVGQLSTGLFLDVETTGLVSSSDRVIQLALVAFEFDASGRVHSILDEYDGYEDPGKPIPTEITELTGITDEDVAGRRLDEARVAQLVDRASLVIAHNAAFDRPFVERRFPAFEHVKWACSIADVDWRGEGHGSSKLEWLAYKHGFYFESHRAGNDCLAGVRLLATELPRSGGTALTKLLANASKSSIRLWAAGSPYAAKDALRARGYRWQPTAKIWWRDLASEAYRDEVEWLTENVYGGREQTLPYLEYDGIQRYSPRISTAPPAATGRKTLL